MSKPTTSVRRRVGRGALLAVAFLAPPLLIGGGTIRARPQSSARVDAPSIDLPAPRVPAPDRKLAVVVTGNHGTEITDTLPVLELLGETRGLDVVVVAPAREASPFVTGLPEDARIDFVPDYSFAEYDALGRDPDLVVVPYLPRWESDDAEAVAWIRAHADDDTTVLSICAGGTIVAASGAFDGHAATANDPLFGRDEAWSERRAQFPAVRWQRDVRWVRDRGRISSSTLAAGMDATLAAIEALIGRAEAERVIATTRYPHGRFLDDPSASPPPAELGVVLEAAFRWEDDDVGILLADGVSEAAVAGLAEAHSATLNMHPFGVAAERRVIRSRHGLALVPRADLAHASVTRVVDPAAGKAGAFAYERGLEEVARVRGPAFARLAADTTNYPHDHLDLDGGWPVGVSIAWRPIALGLAGLAVALLLMRLRTVAVAAASVVTAVPPPPPVELERFEVRR